MAANDSTAVHLAHVGIAVENLQAARKKFAQLLGCEASPIEEVSSEGVRVSFFDLGNCRIELLEGTTPDSPVSRFLAQGRRGVHHLAFSVVGTPLGDLLKKLRAESLPVLDETPRRGAENKEVFFVHPRGADGVLMEFLQEPSAPGDEPPSES